MPEMQDVDDAAAAERSGKRLTTAGAFDIRTLIGGLLGLYGLLLLVTGLWFTSDADKAKVRGQNLNLQVGIGLVLVAAFFLVWVWLRPVRLLVEDGD